MIRILHRSPTWIAVEKPSGVLVIPGRGEGDRVCLRDEISQQLQQRVWVVHRLDRETSGILVLALDAATHRALSIAFEAGRIEKKYWALVRGSVLQPLDLAFALVEGRRHRMRPARAGERGKRARTLVRPIEVFRHASLIEAQPITGRTHQIRVHLAQAGHPLLADPVYAREAVEPQGLIARMPLHAFRVSIHGIAGLDDQEIETPMPQDMKGALARLRAE